jgi:hypothetical protein
LYDAQAPGFRFQFAAGDDLIRPGAEMGELAAKGPAAPLHSLFNILRNNKLKYCCVFRSCFRIPLQNTRATQLEESKC